MWWPVESRQKNAAWALRSWVGKETHGGKDLATSVSLAGAIGA
ncbi:hypothetical protein SM11_pC1381 (plasmid) [Sinorhizobium meliloti SM11]|uniref:Uncharacterized protein n=1 Tax=Sinorhizobium meliloti (strain SM11) TaxID=707241 RepID=F7XB55_SINMM|nr:hypothetical protein SM11_pC1381 [Sinorhizobium meliloti SM11]